MSNMAAFDEAARAQRESQNKSNHLLKLPAELRNRIYILALELGSRYVHSWMYDFNRVCLTTPAILQASRQLRKETLAIWYGEQEYKICVVCWGSDCITWLNSLSTNSVASLRRLAFVLMAEHHHTREGVSKGMSPYRLEPRIHRTHEGLRRSVELVDNGYECGLELFGKNCEAVRQTWAEVKVILKRMEMCNDTTPFNREDLLALLEVYGARAGPSIGQDRAVAMVDRSGVGERRV